MNLINNEKGKRILLTFSVATLKRSRRLVPMAGLVRVAVSEAKRNATLLRLSVITNDKAASNREKWKKVSILLLTFSIATLKRS